ncbi:hypothetical protein MU516_16175 [Paracoccus sp. YLB-12]|uniref:Fe2OG dioxygenase domain-containing protein n=1 Tax=Paracoccus maritimus TaxID=2933292 RepID=A0ABT2KEX0_9RHOB|nr:hypothetical protein [Paracoccus sp. YLB-12]MCT4334400.1 hypothetical protein [Paracoccus sp. YLB-12]
MSEAVLAPVDHEAVALSIAHYGFAALPGAVAAPALSAMRAEARAQLVDAMLAENTAGTLRYRAHLTSLGPHALSFLRSPTLIDLLARHFGSRYSLSEEISCLTRYDAGSHLGAHLDTPRDRCAATVLVYLEAEGPDPKGRETGLVLHVYGEEPDSVASPRLTIPTVAGSIVLGRGSRIWHERPALAPEESVVAITGCYGFQRP